VTKVLPVGLGLLTDTVAISLTLLTEADAAWKNASHGFFILGLPDGTFSNQKSKVG
jgi:hypothetical protein